MFLNPVMLAGIGGAVLPLVLHFLSRSRFRSADWGAMMFLDTGDAPRRHGAKVRQAALLLVRMAMVSMLAVALARPVVAGWWGQGDVTVRRNVVLVVDCSASMGIEEGGRTRLDMAKEAALRILARLKRGDRAALVVMGGPRKQQQGQDGLKTLTADLQSVATATGALRPFAAQASVTEGLGAAAGILLAAADGVGAGHEIYVVSDRQARSWDGLDDAEFATAWQQRFIGSGRAPRLYVVAVGGTSPENVAIESIAPANPPVVRGQPAEVEVRVRNFGRRLQTGVPVSLREGEREVFTTSVNLEPGAVETVRAPVSFPEPGSRVLTASIRVTDMPSDNQMNCAVAVTDTLKVLVLSGDERPGTFRGESDFLRIALTPFAPDSKDRANPAVVTVAQPEPSAGLDLEPYQVVILANVDRLSEQWVRQLEQFVYGGGGLLIAPGNLVQVDRYNQLLYRNGAGLMPGQLQAPSGGPDGLSGTSVLGLTLDHPVFRFLKGSPNPIPPAAVGRYFPVTPREGDSRVLASYASGWPLLIEGEFGRGRVLLTTTPLDADWSTLPLTSFYLPFVQSAARYLAAGNAVSRNLAPGQPIVLTLEDPVDDRSVRVTRPETREPDAAGVEVSRYGRQVEVRYPHTDQAGDYAISYKSGDAARSVHFVVQGPPGESDLTPVTDEAWERSLAAVGMEPVADDPSRTAAGMFALLDDARRELWMPLVLGVVALAIIESMLGRALSAGVR